MRLPWPSRRSAGRATGGSVAAGAGDGARPSGLPVRRSEWRDVGALRPSFHADPSVRQQRFGADLAGSRLPDPILRPLGHARSADGPAGLVSGLTRAAVSRVVAGQASSGSLPLARRRAPAAADVPAANDDTTLVDSPLPDVEPRRAAVVTEAPVVARSMTSARTATSAPVATPARTVASGAPDTAAPLLTTMTPRTLTAGSATRGSDGVSATTPPAVRTILRSPSGSRVRLGPPISRSSDSPLALAGSMDLPRTGSPAAQTTSTPATSGAGRPAVSTPAVATSGATPPGSASGSAGAPIAGSLRPTMAGITASTDASSSGSPAASGASGSDVASSADRPYGRLTPGGLVLARVVDTPDTTVVGAPDAPSGPSSGARTTSAPLVGDQPLSRTSWPPASPSSPSATSGRGLGASGPVIAASSSGGSPTPAAAPSGGNRAIQRQAASTPTSGPRGTATPAAGAGTPDSTTRATRSGRSTWVRDGAPDDRAGNPGVTVGRGGPVRGSTIDGRVTIPAALGPLDRGTGRAALAHELVHVQQQRTLGAQMPAPGSESAHRLESAARTAEAAASFEELTLVRPQAHAAATIDHGSPAGMAVSRSTGSASAGRATAAAHAAMQLADGDAPPPAADTTAVAGSAASSAGANGAAAGGSGLSDRDLDEVLRKLYPRLRRSLSSELLVARERAGMLADHH